LKQSLALDTKNLAGAELMSRAGGFGIFNNY
jgi:hypothetical protein